MVKPKRLAQRGEWAVGRALGRRGTNEARPFQATSQAVAISDRGSRPSLGESGPAGVAAISGRSASEIDELR